MKTANDKASLGYKESRSALDIRIQAHRNYSSFSLEEWINRSLPLKPGDVVMDIGCGNGNLFPSYEKKLGSTGVIVGMDQSEDLLQKAASREGASPKVLLRWDMNENLPFIDASFDMVISSFAIYYVDDVKRIVNQIKRLLKDGGSVFLIGPTDRNAAELYDFNKKIFGFGRDEKINRRTNRLEMEFLPALEEILGAVKSEIIPSKLVFPNREEFVRYYLATLLYEESAAKAAYAPDAEKLASIDMPAWEISKEMIVLCSTKQKTKEK
ncbi:MAG: class I SAM-dependent methyltransferase [Nitrospirae bacterium]|nr:class I SAM-dependent methyltransferase [Nitrospirota bacterium]